MNPDKPTRENKEFHDTLPREIELKIVNLGDIEEFIKKVLGAGGQIIQDRRLIHDTGFKLPEEGGEEKVFELNVEDVEDLEKLKSALNYLGVEIAAEEKNILKIASRKDLPARMARTRIDGGRSFLTVKEKRRPDQEIADRPEIELDFPDAEKARNLLIQIGYRISNEREKYRTSFKIGEVLVEINEGPAGNPWAEVEGPSAADVKKTVELLGYKPEDTADISDGEYYRRQGVPEEKLNSLTFKTHEKTP